MNPQESLKIIREELSQKEIAEIDFIESGKLILNETLRLSEEINTELLEPISKWIDDPEFMKRHAIQLEDQVNWAKYKRQQREWTSDQRKAAGLRLKLYLQKALEKRRKRRELSRLIPKSNLVNTSEPLSAESPTSLNFMLAPFSAKGQRTATLTHKFETLPLSKASRLPYLAFLSADIQNKTNFDSLPYYSSEDRAERIAKFQALLQLDHDGLLNLSQNAHQGDIEIAPCSAPDSGQNPNSTHEIHDKILIETRNGTTHTGRWSCLSQEAKKQLLSDALSGKIICKNLSQTDSKV